MNLLMYFLGSLTETQAEYKTAENSCNILLF